ncbi:MAG: acyl-CoA dehydratase activase-related protein [Methylocystaceae bacterium]
MKGPRIGIPDAMYNRYFYPFIKTFWQEVGFIPVFSAPTNREILDTGVRAAVDEACLPLKVYYGHVASLEAMQLDYLMLPRFTSVEERAYLCPKSMGLPYMVKAEMNLHTPLVIPSIDLSRGDTLFRKELHFWGQRLKISRLRLSRGLQQAYQAQAAVGSLARKNQLTYPQAIQLWDTGTVSHKHVPVPGRITVGLVGHGYLTYDDQISLGLTSTLEQMGIRVQTPEMLNHQLVNEYSLKLPKRVFWSLGYNIMGAALAWQDRQMVDGIIHITCFGCGPNSLIGEMLQQNITQLPLLMLTIDEHTGQAGQQTRLEAFIDLLERKKRHAG